MEATETMR